jgi:hypothetical protein
VPDRNVLFGVGLGAWNGADAVTAEQGNLFTEASDSPLRVPAVVLAGLSAWIVAF